MITALEPKIFFYLFYSSNHPENNTKWITLTTPNKSSVNINSHPLNNSLRIKQTDKHNYIKQSPRQMFKQTRHSINHDKGFVGNQKSDHAVNFPVKKPQILLKKLNMEFKSCYQSPWTIYEY